eukprot:XP_001701632.1 predicted protein [Chlamydomonas reinhardtii]
MTAVADVRACAVLAQRYDSAVAAAATRALDRQSPPHNGGGARSRQAADPDAASATSGAGEAAAAAARLAAAVEGLVVAAAAEDTVLRSPTVFAALQAAAAVSADTHDIRNSAGGGGATSSGASAGLPPHRHAMVSALVPRFVRQGYHPPSPHAYSVALRAEDKAALLEAARRQERALLAALEGLLGPAPPPAPPPPPPPPPLEADLQRTAQPTHQQAQAADAAQVPSDDEAAWLDAQLAQRLALASSSAAAAAGGARGAAPGRSGLALSYEWPLYDLGTEELQEDAVMADVAAAQWRQQAAADEGSGADGLDVGGGVGAGAGGQLRLTLDVCAGLLRRHPDPVLRQQVYEEGLVPLAAAALELMQRLRDVRAQQAALYGMYEHDLLHAVQQQGPYGQGPGKATAAAGGGSSGGGLWASLLPPMPPPPPQPLGAVAAAAAGAAAGAAPGAAGLAHLDSLAGDGRAVALFLTDLARELEPRVEAQVRQLAATTCGALAAGDVEYGLRQLAWRPGGARGGAQHHDGLLAGAADADPVSAYLTDPAALLAGVSDWLGGFMGVRLVRPGGSSGAGPRAEGGGEGAGGGGEGAGGAGASSCGHRDAALSTLAAAAAREPGRFLAYRLVVEEEEEEGREEGQEAGREVGGNRSEDKMDGCVPAGEPVRRWLLIDLYGGGGTRYVLPPVAPPLSGPAAAAAAGSTHGGNSAQPAAVAVLVGLQGGAGAASSSSSSSSGGGPGVGGAGIAQVRGGPGGREGTEAVGLLARGSEFAVWELMHELGHALHFLLAAAPPPPPPPSQTAGGEEQGHEAVHASNCATAGQRAGVDMGVAAAGERRRDEPQAPAPAAGGSPGPSPGPSGSGAAGLCGSLWRLPYLLPLELVELPACLMERAAAEPGVAAVLLAHCRDAEGRPPPPAVAEALAHAVRVMHFSPVSVQVQVRGGGG